MIALRTRSLNEDDDDTVVTTVSDSTVPHLLGASQSISSGSSVCDDSESSEGKGESHFWKGYGRSNGVVNRSDSRSDTGQQVKRGRNARNMFSQVPLSTSETEVPCEEQLKEMKRVNEWTKGEVQKRRKSVGLKWKRERGGVNTNEKDDWHRNK